MMKREFRNSQHIDTLAAGIEVISPQIYTQDLFVDSINTLSSGDLALNLSPDGIFSINNSQNSTAISFDSYGNAFFAGEITANKLTAQIAGLDIINEQLVQLTNKVESAETGLAELLNGLTVSGESSFKGLTTFAEDIHTLKNINVEGQLTVKGSSSFEGLVRADKIIVNELESPVLTELKNMIENTASKSADISTHLAGLESQREIDIKELLALEGGLIVQGLTTLNGGLEVSEIKSTDEYIAFTTDTMFFGRPYFNSDTGGFAIIYEGQQRVDIIFEKEYLELPIINVTMKYGSSSLTAEELLSQQNVNSIVEQKDGHGFSILLDQPVSKDINFGWTAIAVKNPKTFFSEKTPIIINVEPLASPEVQSPTESPIPEPTATLEPTPELTPETSPEVTPDVQPQLEPTLEITPTPEPILQPSPEATTGTTEPTPESAPEPTPEPTPKLSTEPIP